MPKAEPEKSCCAKKIETGHKKCCTDKTINLKGKAIDVIVKMASVDYAVPFVLPVDKPIVFGETTPGQARNLPTYYCDAHAPPLFKLYHQYIFYA